MEEEIIQVEDEVEVFIRPVKRWWVSIRQMQLSEDGTVYGIGSDNKMYNWHHSLEHAGEWVLLVTGR